MLSLRCKPQEYSLENHVNRIHSRRTNKAKSSFPWQASAFSPPKHYFTFPFVFADATSGSSQAWKSLLSMLVMFLSESSFSPVGPQCVKVLQAFEPHSMSHPWHFWLNSLHSHVHGLLIGTIMTRKPTALERTINKCYRSIWGSSPLKLIYWI